MSYSKEQFEETTVLDWPWSNATVYRHQRPSFQCVTSWPLFSVQLDVPYNAPNLIFGLWYVLAQHILLLTAFPVTSSSVRILARRVQDRAMLICECLERMFPQTQTRCGPWNMQSLQCDYSDGNCNSISSCPETALSGARLAFVLQDS